MRILYGILCGILCGILSACCVYTLSSSAGCWLRTLQYDSCFTAARHTVAQLSPLPCIGNSATAITPAHYYWLTYRHVRIMLPKLLYCGRHIAVVKPLCSRCAVLTCRGRSAVRASVAVILLVSISSVKPPLSASTLASSMPSLTASVCSSRCASLLPALPLALPLVPPPLLLLLLLLPVRRDMKELLLFPVPALLVLPLLLPLLLLPLLLLLFAATSAFTRGLSLALVLSITPIWPNGSTLTYITPLQVHRVVAVH
jgi:hypothetical protein